MYIYSMYPINFPVLPRIRQRPIVRSVGWKVTGTHVSVSNKVVASTNYTYLKLSLYMAQPEREKGLFLNFDSCN